MRDASLRTLRRRGIDVDPATSAPWSRVVTSCVRESLRVAGAVPAQIEA